MKPSKAAYSQTTRLRVKLLSYLSLLVLILFTITSAKAKAKSSKKKNFQSSSNGSANENMYQKRARTMSTTERHWEETSELYHKAFTEPGLEYVEVYAKVAILLAFIAGTIWYFFLRDWHAKP